MSLIGNLFGKRIKITMYISDTCADCTEAKKFFADYQIDVKYKNIAEQKNREELKTKYKRMAVPTIIIDNKVILGFANNRSEIMKLLNL